MGSSVHLQTTNGPKWHGTLITRKEFLSRVGSSMILYMVNSKTAFSIQKHEKMTWDIDHMWMVSLHIVFFYASSNYPLKKIARNTNQKEMFFPSMGSTMCLQLISFWKWLGTLITRKCFFSNVGLSMHLLNMFCCIIWSVSTCLYQTLCVYSKLSLQISFHS